MRKFLTLIFVFIVSVCLFSFNAIADDSQNSIRIEFCVGDDTLLINGNSVQVEKPYVAGDGVTLVPLRVISEAFGAEVEWIDETSGIKITYPDVNIYLQINNPVAEVNEMAQELPNAPELINGYAMVPLRFISETFGATVSYDEETEKITVEKNNVEEGSIVEGTITSERIGDSYYGWSMENPKNMQISPDFGRAYISLYSDEGNYIDISIKNDTDYDIEKAFENEKKSSRYSGAVLTADLDVSDPSVKIIHFSTDYEHSYSEKYIIATDKYVYTINANIYSDDQESIDEFCRIVSTFEPTYTGDDTHDFSNVENGMRLYEDETLNLSLCVPAIYSPTDYNASKNQITFYPDDEFYSDTDSAIIINVYSLSDSGTAQEMATGYYEFNKKTMNENLARFSENVESKKYGEYDVFEYIITVENEENSYKSADIFLSAGEYTYNFTIIANDDTDFESHVKSIMDSVKIKELDPKETGLLFADNLNIDETRSVEIGSCTIDLPKLFDDNYLDGWSDEGTHAFMASLANCELSVAEEKDKKKLSELKAEIEEAKESASGIIETVSDIKEITIGSNKCLKYTEKMNYMNETAYIEIYCTIKGSNGYIFCYIFDEMAYSEYLRNMAQDIVASLKIA